MTHIKNNWYVFWQLVQRDLIIYMPEYYNRALNSIIWSSITVFIYQYILPQAGLTQNFGSLLLAANIASVGFFDTTEVISTILSDLTGDRAISYYLTIPIPQYLIFIQMGLSNAIKGFLGTLPLLPAGMLVLGTLVPFPHFVWWKFLLLMIIANLFYGFFALLTTSLTKDIASMSNLWIRVVFPMWFLGGYQFTWKQLYNASPLTAYLDLLNPMIYISEGMRACTIDPQALPFELCASMIILFTIVFGYIGTKRFMKRLDCL
jgi:hypothetical protein